MDTQVLQEQLLELFANSTFQVSAGLTVLVIALCCCRIYAKAGFHGAMGLLMLVPGVNLVMLVALAFGHWPVHKQARELRMVNRVLDKSKSRAA